jgi:hypothetical protein
MLFHFQRRGSKAAYGLGVRTNDSTKIGTLIWGEGRQFIGAKEAGRPLPLGKTVAELGLSGKTIELSGFDSEDEEEEEEDDDD